MNSPRAIASASLEAATMPPFSARGATLTRGSSARAAVEHLAARAARGRRRRRGRAPSRRSSGGGPIEHRPEDAGRRFVHRRDDREAGLRHRYSDGAPEHEAWTQSLQPPRRAEERDPRGRLSPSRPRAARARSSRWRPLRRGPVPGRGSAGRAAAQDSRLVARRNSAGGGVICTSGESTRVSRRDPIGIGCIGHARESYPEAIRAPRRPGGLRV